METKRAVHRAGGWMHEPGPAVDGVDALLDSRGFVCEPVDRFDDVCAALDAPCDLLVVSACWFSMSDARYTDDQRRDWAVARDLQRRHPTLTPACRTAAARRTASSRCRTRSTPTRRGSFGWTGGLGACWLTDARVRHPLLPPSRPRRRLDVRRAGHRCRGDPSRHGRRQLRPRRAGDVPRGRLHRVANVR